MTLERDFAAWLDHRDPAALARVFDETAGRLVLLAAHVAGGGGTAEDLVQATFLAAMARGTTWDRSRELWPWLAAILQNEARMQWRRRRRRREVGISAAGNAHAGAPDPARLAESADAFAAVAVAVDALPLPYRRVLRLRLVHGLRQVEIAHALEVPVGTVRAQVHRGLAMLRERLPAGVAVVATAWLAGDGGLLAQVRGRVLEQAANECATAAPGLLLAGGWWAMHGKTWMLVAAGVALSLTLGIAFGVVPGAGGAMPAPSAPGEAVAGLGVAESSSSPTVGTPPARTPQPQPARWEILVRAVSPRGAPVAGAEVEMWLEPRAWGREGDALRTGVARGATAADGTFACSIDALRGHDLLARCSSVLVVEATHPRGAADRVTLALPRTEDPQRLTAELTLARGAVVGRVVDAGGAPVEGAEIAWLAEPSRGRDAQERGRTGANGAFRMGVGEDDVRQGRGAVLASDSRLGSVLVPLAGLPFDDGIADAGTLMLTARAGVRGRVVLGDGIGLGGFPVRVVAIDPAAGGSSAAVEVALQQGQYRSRLELDDAGRVRFAFRLTTTALDGSFACADLDPSATYAVAVRDTCMRWIAATARPGGDPVRLVVDRQLVALDVCGPTGEPLPGARIVAVGSGPGGERHPRVRARFHPSDPRGRRLLLSPFGWRWRLEPRDEFARAEPLTHRALAGIHRAERVLALEPETRFGALRVTVVDEHGQPWSAYGIDLRCLDRDLGRDHSASPPPEDETYRELPAGRWRVTVHAGSGTALAATDGRARSTIERDVLIEEGRTTELEVVTEPSGRVAFWLESAAERVPDRWQGVTVRSGHDGTPVPLRELTLSTPSPGPVAYGRLSSSGRVLAGFVTETGLRPGTHAFVVAADGHQPARCEVEVVDDRVVHVELTLRAR